MNVKIINILKDDSFNDILELFRQAPAGEVILVLPRVGKIFKREDHFAAFASEAKQGNKTLSLLTSNSDIAKNARDYGFGVMASNTAPAKPKKSPKKKPSEDIEKAIVTEPVPSDDDTVPQSDIDNDVPLTSDETMDVEGLGEKPEEEYYGTPVADLTAQPPKEQGLDYIDAVWRDKTGKKMDFSRPALKKDRLRFLRTPAFSKKIAIGILATAVVAFGGVVYVMAGSARVALTPVSRPLDARITIQASDVFTAVDDTFAKLPGQLLDVHKTASNTVTATGQRDVASKARGIITVSNAYSSSPQTLIATTRFKSESGKIFRTLQSVTVPGSTIKEGKTVPGTTTVEVIADKSGPEYNVPDGKFIIAAFQEKGDTEKVEKFYGESSQAMSGGASGPSAVVTQENYDEAKDAAVNEVKEQIRSALAAQGPSLMVLNADSPDISDLQGTARPDDAAQAVTVTATGTLKTIAFRKDDLYQLIQGIILKKERAVVVPDQLDLSYEDVQFKPDLGTLTFTVAVRGDGYTPIDTDTIKGDIIGKKADQIRTYFQNREGVLSATVTLSPFWIRSVPKNTEKISVDLLYDPAE